MNASRRLALPLVLTVALAACGGSDESGETLPAPAGAPATVESEPDGAPDGDAAMLPIGAGNVGGPVVDPKRHDIDRIDIAESLPEQLVVAFTAGDPNCTAADATASITGDVVLVELFVGITEDALATSCTAGDFEQSITIPLDQPLDGREVVPAVPPEADGEPNSAPLPGDGSVEAMAEAIVGLDAETAEMQVVDGGWVYRVVELDGEPPDRSDDERADRINVAVENGVVTDAQVF